MGIPRKSSEDVIKVLTRGPSGLALPMARSCTAMPCSGVLRGSARVGLSQLAVPSEVSYAEKAVSIPPSSARIPAVSVRI